MKYWFVFFDGIYKIRNSQVFDIKPHEIAMFTVFDMAYDYVTKANKTNDTPAYSRWTTAR